MPHPDTYVPFVIRDAETLDLEPEGTVVIEAGGKVWRSAGRMPDTANYIYRGRVVYETTGEDELTGENFAETSDAIRFPVTRVYAPNAHNGAAPADHVWVHDPDMCGVCDD